MTTEIAKNKTLEEALKITEDNIINALSGLPENKKHCSNLGVAVLRNAIEDYHKTKPSYSSEFKIKKISQ